MNKRRTLKELGITSVDGDVVLVMGSLYVKTPEALDRLLCELRGIGYKVKDCHKLDKYEKERGITVEQKEQDAWSLWYASLDIRQGKCGSCNKYVPTQGIRFHGKTCPHCGAVLYRDIVDGSTVKFMFTKSEYGFFAYTPTMTAKYWDFDNEDLYLYRGIQAYCNSDVDGLKESMEYVVGFAPAGSRVACKNCGHTRFKTFSKVDGVRNEVSCRKCGTVKGAGEGNLLIAHTEDGPCVVSAASFADTYQERRDGIVERIKALENHLAQNTGQWEAVEQDGVNLVKVKFMRPWDRDRADINPCNIHGHEFNSTIVKVWKGKEYSEYDNDLPVSDSYSVYEAWHWAPWGPSGTLHAKAMSACGQVSRQDYYYQDGRPAFYPGMEEQLSKFIEHFTTLDHEAFLTLWPRMRKDGPGFIEDFALFCSGEEVPVIQNEPNAWGAIMGIHKMVGGGHLTEREIMTVKTGVEDPMMKTLMGYK